MWYLDRAVFSECAGGGSISSWETVNNLAREETSALLHCLGRRRAYHISLIDCPFFKRSTVQLDQIWPITFDSDRFTGHQELIRHNTLLIARRAQYHPPFKSLCSLERWWLLVGMNPRSLCWWSLKSIHISSPVTVRWKYAFCFYLPSTFFHTFWRRWSGLLVNQLRPHFPTFRIYTMALSDIEFGARRTPKWSTTIVFDWVASLSKKACKSRSLIFQSRILCCTLFKSSLATFNRQNNLCRFYQYITDFIRR